MVTRKIGCLVLSGLAACLLFLGEVSPVVAKESPDEGSVQTMQPVNLNKATLDELQSIRGVGPVIAQRIVDYRVAHGPFRVLEELAQVNGIGQAKYEKMKDQMTL